MILFALLTIPTIGWNSASATLQVQNSQIRRNSRSLSNNSAAIDSSVPTGLGWPVNLLGLALA